MELIETKLPDIKILQPKVFQDDRGFFLESYNQKKVEELLQMPLHFVQDNHSRSRKHVLRGLHYQLYAPQGKLIRVTQGAIYDVVVDLRRKSPTFGQWLGLHLSATNFQMVWVPPGFAHGFLALTDQVDLLYKVTTFYNGSFDRSLLWCDPALAIDWPLTSTPLLSDKDAQAVLLKNAEVFEG